MTKKPSREIIANDPILNYAVYVHIHLSRCKEKQKLERNAQTTLISWEFKNNNRMNTKLTSVPYFIHQRFTS
jgi:hypothetical protein